MNLPIRIEVYVSRDILNEGAVKVDIAISENSKQYTKSYLANESVLESRFDIIINLIRKGMVQVYGPSVWRNIGNGLKNSLLEKELKQENDPSMS